MTKFVSGDDSIGTLHRHIGATGAYGYTHIGCGKRRSIVYAIAHKGHGMALSTCILHYSVLGLRQQFFLISVSTHSFGSMSHGLGSVAGQNYDFFHAQTMQLCHSGRGIGLESIVKVNGTGIAAIHSHTHQRGIAGRRGSINLTLAHESGTARQHTVVIDRAFNTVGYGAHIFGYRHIPGSLAYSHSQRVSALRIKSGHISQESIGSVTLSRLNSRNRETACGKCAGFVKIKSVNGAHGIKIAATLEQHTHA